MPGLAAAAAAALIFNVAAALQAFAARTRPRDENMRWLLLWRLAHQRYWMAGLLLTALGFPFQLYALSHAPFTVVQPIISAGLLVLLGLCVWLLRERVGPRELAGVAGIVIGIALLAWHAPPQTARLSGTLAPALVIAGLCAITAVPFCVRGRGRQQSLPAIIGSGVILAASSIAAKGTSDQLSAGNFAAAAVWLGIAAATGALALLMQMSAIQCAPANRVFPPSVALQTAVPLVLAPVYLESASQSAAWQHGSVLVGLIALVAGLAAVASAGSVSELATGAPRVAYAVEGAETQPD